MSEITSNERIQICDQISLKLDNLSALVSSLVALGISAASDDSLSFIPSERITDTFLSIGQMANQLHEELTELNKRCI